MIGKRTKKIILFFATLAIVVGSSFLFVHTSSAQTDFGLTNEFANSTGLGQQDLRVTVAKIIRAVLGLLGIIAVVLMLYAGFLWMTSEGNEEKIGQAKKILINTVIGLAIILSSMAITQFILSRLSAATGTGGSNIPLGCNDPEGCPDPDCQTFPASCPSVDDHFVVKSITPRTEATNMQNLVVRAIFNRPIDPTTGANTVMKIYQGDNDVSDQFNYAFDSNSANKMVEATPISDCPSATDGKCVLTTGNYRVVISDQLKDNQNNSIEFGTYGSTSFPLTANFNVNNDAIDKIKPEATPIRINGSTQPIVVRNGRYLTIQSDITDQSGAGYTKLQLELNDSPGVPVGSIYFDGPLVSRGSDAALVSPYHYSFPLPAPGGSGAQTYNVALTVFDLDNNSTTTRASFVLVDEHCTNNTQDADEDGEDCGGVACGSCEGGPCVTDLDCGGYLSCITGVCKPYPVIFNVDAWNGAAGNLVTVAGKYFGTVPGQVLFGLVPAELPTAECNISTWHDSYVVVKVPSDDLLDLDSASVVKINVPGKNDANQPITLTDTTDDNHGPRPGDLNFTGYFTKNTTIRPGLCSVTTPDNARAGEPNDAIIAKGTGFGTTQGTVLFGTVLAPITGWFGGLINTAVPNNMGFGSVAVKVNVNDQNSNSILFNVLNPDEDAMPVIESVDPASVTKGSFVTIFGKRFGETKGEVWLANSSATSHQCAVDGVDGEDGCYLVSSYNIPQCRDGWHNNEVIIFIPTGGSLSVGSYFVSLQTEDGLITSGETRLTIIDGAPLPGICSLEPNYGPAPRPSSDPFIRLDGINFGTLNTGVPESVNLYSNPGFELNLNHWVAVGTTGLMGVGEVSYFNRTGGDAYSFDGNYLDGNAVAYVSMLTGDTGMNALYQELSSLAPGSAYTGSIWSRSASIGDLTNLSLVIKSRDQFGNNFYWNFNGLGSWEADSAGGLNPTSNQIKTFVIDPAEGTDWKKYSYSLPSNKGIVAYYWGLKPDDGGRVYFDQAEFKINSVASLNPTLYFWKRGADTANPATWLSNNIYNSFSNNTISTLIPVDQETNVSMDSGPIKLKVGENYSNAVNYRVENCLTPGYSIPSGMRCCTTGPNAGQMIPSANVCAGETREAGYVWRFSSGLIPNYPEVVYECNDTAGVFPSPTPSSDWEDGDLVCVNADVAVRFSEPMKKNTLNSANVELWKCNSGGSEINCDDAVLVPLNGEDDLSCPSDEGDLSCTVGSPFTILDNSSGSRLDSDSWYQVKLKTGITSYRERTYTLRTEFEEIPLKINRPCGDGTAYCFDFKTSATGEKCLLTRAGVTPLTYTSNQLGPIKKQTGTDLVYSVFGIPGKCRALGVRNYNWDWQPETSSIYVGVSDFPGHQDWATATAKKQTVGLEGVKILASVNKSEILNDTTPGTITGSSTLYIILGDPEVTDWWPKCMESCINASIGARFNREMVTTTYSASGNIKLYKCQNENCVDSLTSVDISFDQGLSDVSTVVFSPADANGLASSTWYKVELNDGVKAIGGYNVYGGIIAGESITPFSWKFRTKNDNTPCQIGSASVTPTNFVAKMIGEKTAYRSLSFGSPDTCSSFGQLLNPSLFSWAWNDTGVAPNKVAEITNFSSKGNYVPWCGADCLPDGSDIARGTVVSLCGNGVVEAGEDCDIGISGEEYNESCTLNCLRPGNKEAGTTLHKCGNSVIDWEAGEECDPPGEFCTAQCLKKGSSSTFTGGISRPICRSGDVTAGEDCDLAIPANPTNPLSAQGCSSSCLHTGTSLSIAWCAINNPTDPAEVFEECNTAQSICGNGTIESGEECEIFISENKVSHIFGGNVVKVPLTNPQNYCDNNCLLKNVCSTPLAQCEITESGCNNDCTLAGSSLTYSASSFCGDGVEGDGEYYNSNVKNSCEQIGTTAFSFGLPFQVATAIGLGTVDPVTKSQTTKINATAVGYHNPITGGIANLTPTQRKTGSSTYYLQCGYTETNETPYNTCPGGGIINGAATNSCCYPRLSRTEEYPEANETEVCRNTVISVKFPGRIDEETVANNLTLAKDGTGVCITGSDNDVSNYIAMADENINQGGFWSRIWQGIKGFFAGLFGKTEKAMANVPLEKGHFNGTTATQLPAGPSDIFVRDNLAYVIFDKEGGDVNDSLKIINVSNSELPVVKGTYTSSTIFDNAKSIYVSGNYAYVAVNGTNIQDALVILDISSSTNPKYVSRLVDNADEVKLAQPSSVFVANNYAYIASFTDNALEIVDVTNPVQPVHKGSFVSSTALAGASAVYVSEKYAYVTAQISNSLSIIDISNPSVPVFKGIIRNGVENGAVKLNGASSLFVKDNLAYVIAYGAHDYDGALEIVDVSNPEKPIHQGSISGLNPNAGEPNYFNSVKVLGKYAYIGATNMIHIVDISNPSVPVKFLTKLSDNIAMSTSLSVANGYVYVVSGTKNESASYSYFQIIDFSADYCIANEADFEPTISYETDENGVVTTTVSLKLLSALKADERYYMVLRGGPNGIKDDKGVGIKAKGSSVLSLNDSWWFRTGPDICKLRSVIADPDYKVFFYPGATGDFDARAISTNNNQNIQSIAGSYEWTWDWIPHTDKNPLFDIPASNNDKTLPEVKIAARNLEGSITASINATVTADVDGTAGVGRIFSDQVTLIASFCSSTWPVNATRGQTGEWTPFSDDTYHFSFSYCADAGNAGTTVDDLPILISNPKTTGLSADLLKQYLFTNIQNDDVVGVRIFQNQNNLTSREWYESRFTDASRMRDFSIGGYLTLMDGNNYYVSAVNKNGNTYLSNMYLFSINNNAQASTKQVFEQIIRTLELNTNVDKDNYCATASGLTDITCQDDFDCRTVTGTPKTGANGTCANDRLKLARDWQRLQDLKLIQNKIKSVGNTRIPQLEASTYYPGYTVSRWPSWMDTLATSLGGDKLPVDPINEWTECGPAGTAQQTCWRAPSSTYHCPQFSSVYEYEYSTTTGYYTIHAPLEYFKVTWTLGGEHSLNANGVFVDKFVSTTIPGNSWIKLFDDHEWCTPDTVKSPLGAKCGDNIVQNGEGCDPPGASRLSTCPMPNTALNNCNNACYGSGISNCFDECSNLIAVEDNDYLDIGGFPGSEFNICSENCLACKNQCTQDYPPVIGNIKHSCTASCEETISSCYDNSYCGNKIREGGEVCDDGKNNGTYGQCNVDCDGYVSQRCGNDIIDYNSAGKPLEFCDTVGDSCHHVGQDVQTYNSVSCVEYSDNKNNTCSVTCQSYGRYCGDRNVDEDHGETCDDGNTIDDDQCKNTCSINTSYVAPENRPAPEAVCGNGDKEGNEICDDGNDNGKECTPGYGLQGRCSYCASDCSQYVYKESDRYCGNGNIDIISEEPTTVHEACDLSVAGGVTTVYGSNGDPLNCGTNYYQKGLYSCENNCTNLVNGCVDCIFTTSTSAVAAIAQLSILNPMVGKGGTVDIWNDVTKIGLFGWTGNPTGTLYPGYVANSFVTDNVIKYDSVSGIFKVDDLNSYPDPGQYNFHNARLVTAPQCSYVYNISFNSIYQLGLGGAKFLDAFNYPVNNEADIVNNELIVSPALPRSAVRVVVRWNGEYYEQKKKDVKFSLSAYSTNFIPTSHRYSYLTGFSISDICNSISKIDYNSEGLFYWWPVISSTCNQHNDDGVYVHDINKLKKTNIHSLTIDLGGDSNGGYPIAIFVEATNGTARPIADFKYDDVEVDVYEYNPEQASETSIYKPVKTFKIKGAAGTSSNSLANYWHVFNLFASSTAASGVEVQDVYEDGGYDSANIGKSSNHRPDGTIETGFGQIQCNIPGETIPQDVSCGS